MNCSCDKDSRYLFACKKGVRWFTSNELLTKIRRRQKSQPDLDVAEFINLEYAKCKAQYKSLLMLQPQTESALQIERDLGRTFPKNAFFQQG
jgi:hypothetical protein